MGPKSAPENLKACKGTQPEPYHSTITPLKFTREPLSRVITRMHTNHLYRVALTTREMSSRNAPRRLRISSETIIRLS